MKNNGKIHSPDIFLAILIACLTGLGLFILFSSSSARGIIRFNDPYYFLKHQVEFGLLPGILAFLMAYFVPYGIWRKIAFPLFGLTLFILGLLVFPKFGLSFQGATRWFKVGDAAFQPAEFLKIAMIMYLAGFFASRRSRIKDFKSVSLPFLVILGISAILLAIQPATGTLGILVLVSFAMYYLAGAPLRTISAIIFVGFTIFTIFIFSAGYRRERILTFLDPGHDQAGQGYQINQAMISIGSGGLAGRGIGQSRQKFNFLPETIGDSIFAVFAEETGFIGSSILLLLFFFFGWRGLRLARKSPDAFAYFLAGGLTIWVMVQAFFNIAAITGLMPLTGIPLPFVSYGGSSLATILFGSGLLLRISRHIAQ